MNRTKTVSLVITCLLLVSLLIIASTLFVEKPRELAQARLVALPSKYDLNEFDRVTGPRELRFPRDHGLHPDFLTEWWYYTGNVRAENGNHFGYQLTFFRRALQPVGQRNDRISKWATNQVYMAHFTLTDVDKKSFYTFERFERGAVGLAGVQSEPMYQVWLRDWSVEQTGENDYLLKASEENISIYFRLFDKKGIIFQGNQGYSQKGPEEGNASLYYSQTRLQTMGVIEIDNEKFQVDGLSWFDREISTSALSQGQIGWDWFALQMDDGSELMAYNLRRSDGEIDPYSTATWIYPDGSSELFSLEYFTVTPIDTWRSAVSGGEYPSKWVIQIPSLEVTLEVEPLLNNQELNLSYTYWEGAVRINGTRGDTLLTGFGYVELTGYAQSLEGGL